MKTFWRVTRWARAVRFWLFVLVALAAWVGCSGEARAQDTSQCMNMAWTNHTPIAYCASREQAYQAMLGLQAAAVQLYSEIEYGVGLCGAGEPAYRLTGRWAGDSTAKNACRRFVVVCPDGGIWDEAEKRCEVACSQRSLIDDQGFLANAIAGVCIGGCTYMAISSGVTVVMGDSAYSGGATWAPTGATCSLDTPPETPHDPEKPVCIATGNGFSECVEPSGRHCVTGAKGGRYCWAPFETGPRSNSQGTEGATRNPPGEPPQKPPNMPDAESSPGATTTVNGVTNSVTNFTGSGGAPGQGNVGEGGRDGPGSGSGDGDGDGDGPGGVGGGLGTLYESHEKTVESVFLAFKTRISEAPVVDMVSDFLSLPSGGGGCPVITVPASQYWDALTFNGLCSGELALLLQYAGYLFLAFVAIVAVRIAFGG